MKAAQCPAPPRIQSFPKLPPQTFKIKLCFQGSRGEKAAIHNRKGRSLIFNFSLSFPSQRWGLISRYDHWRHLAGFLRVPFRVGHRSVHLS